MLEPGIYKFVCVGDHDFRFFSNDESHDQHVKPEERPLVTSAGTVAVFENYWKLYSAYSQTLGVISDSVALIPRLKRLIQRPFKEMNDYSEVQEDVSTELFEDLVGVEE